MTKTKKRNRQPFPIDLPPTPTPKRPPGQGVVLRALADLLRFVADRLADLAGRM